MHSFVDVLRVLFVTSVHITGVLSSTSVPARTTVNTLYRVVQNLATIMQVFVVTTSSSDFNKKLGYFLETARRESLPVSEILHVEMTT